MADTAAASIATRYADVIRDALPVRKIVLFGSQAAGTARAGSDIDVAVIMRDIGARFLDLAAELYRLRGRVDLSIEPVLLDEAHDRSGFLAEVLRTGQVLYDAEKT